MPVTKLRPSFTFTEDRLAELKAVVPEAFADGKINWDVLREALGEYLEGENQEHFGLFWPGKREARRLAAMLAEQTPRRRPDLRALAVEVSLAEVAIHLKDRGMSEHAYEPLQELHSTGVVFCLGWPALLPRLLGELAGVMGRWNEATTFLNEAVALAGACGAKTEIAKSELQFARMCLARRASGDGPLARDHAGRAYAVARELPHVADQAHRLLASEE